MRRLPARRSTRAVLLVGFLALALGGCFRDSDPIELDSRLVTLHAVLEAGRQDAVVRLERSGADPISDAEVRLIHGADTTWAVESMEGPACTQGFGFPGPADPRGCYHATLPAAIDHGETYRLEIRLPEGGTLTGETRVGAAPAINAPATVQRITVRCTDEESCYAEHTPEPPYLRPVGSFTVSWDSPEDAEQIEVRLVGRAAYLDGQDHGPVCHLGHSSGTTVRLAPDSVLWGVTGISCEGELAPARFDSIRAELVVTALNREYARYLDAVGSGSSVRGETVAQGISGGYGVFGAVAPARREVVLVRE